MQLSEKQNEFIREANRRWNLKIGAVRSGKTFVDLVYTVPSRIRAGHGKEGLNVILGVSRETIERNVLQPMREVYTSRLVGNINSRNIARIFGEDCYCLGAEKVNQVAKIQGSSIKYCYGDEIAKWNQEVFAMLQSRLDKPYSCFDGSCNPEYPSHWLKAFIDREDIDLYLQSYTIHDNPFLDPAFVENLCKEYAGTVYYQRYILGEWTLAEGLIYPRYDDAIKPAPDGDPDAWGLSIDYGTQNAFAALLWAKHGDVWFVVREYYYSGRDTGVQKTDNEYADDLDRFTEGIGSPQDKLHVVIDPSAASFIALLRKRGKYRVIPADNAVADGIRETASCMAQGKIKIDPSCKNLIRELQGYVWDDSAGEDRPVKENDHACDALRYWCKTKQLAKVRRQIQRPIGYGGYVI